MEMREADVARALETCAEEPVHIPGCIQPTGVLLAYGSTTGTISHVSANAEDFLGTSPEALIGQNMLNSFGPDLWHGLKNAAIVGGRSPAGTFDLGSGPLDFHSFESDSQMVVEAEPWADDPHSTIQNLSFLINRVQATDSVQALFQQSSELLRSVTGYDRVMIYRFDRDWNGEVVAEARPRSIEPFLGLRFPHWDIPPQARAMMLKSDLRFICDVDQTPVPLITEKPALDISSAFLRGVSPVHMTYLRNIGAAASLTLSVIIEGKLWGTLSFHHRRPRTPTLNQRQILVGFLRVFETKLNLLEQQDAL